MAPIINGPAIAPRAAATLTVACPTGNRQTSPVNNLQALRNCAVEGIKPTWSPFPRQYFTWNRITDR